MVKVKVGVGSEDGGEEKGGKVNKKGKRPKKEGKGKKKKKRRQQGQS